MPKKKQNASVELHSNKIYQVLLHLTAGDQKRLMKFLISPYFNQSKTLIRLCELLLKNAETNLDGFVREEVWRKIFPGEAYDDVNFRKYCSDLLKLVEQFMAQENFMQDESRRNIEILNFVARRNIKPLENSALKVAQNDFMGKAFNPSNYFNNYQFEKAKYTLKGFDRRTQGGKTNIEEISLFLDYFYLIEKLRILCSAYSQKRWVNYDFSGLSEENVLTSLGKINLEEVPELAIYFYAFQILKNEDSLDSFLKLKSHLSEYATTIPIDEAVALFESAINYCIGKVNKGYQEFFEYHFEMINIALRAKIFLVDGELKEWRFNNIVGTALRLGKLEWAEEFISSYKDYLPLDSRENTFIFNLARVYRYQKKYDKVLTLLRNIVYEDINYNLISKAMLIITYYELDEHDALDSFVESFRVFLSRQKELTQERRKGYLNLIKYVRRLTRLLPGDQAGIDKLRAEIIREKATTVNHEWLLEKLAELQ